MARTKSIVLPIIHKSARTGRETSLGVKAFNPRELARANLPRGEREKIAANLEESKRLGYSFYGLLQLCKAFDANFSGLPRNYQDASGATPERMAVGVGRGASRTSRGEKKAKKTEEERDATELAIDGTDLLDPRKASPEAFGASATGGMGTRRSATKQSVDVGDVKSTAIVAHKTVDLQEKNQATEEDASGLGLRPQIAAGMEPESDLESELSDVSSNISAPTPSAKPTTEPNIKNHVIPNGAELARTNLSIVDSNASSSRSIASPSPTEASKRRSRLEKELETTGAPLIQERIMTAGTLSAKEYSANGRRWYGVPVPDRPDWAVYEREVDIRRDE